MLRPLPPLVTLLGLVVLAAAPARAQEAPTGDAPVASPEAELPPGASSDDAAPSAAVLPENAAAASEAPVPLSEDEAYWTRREQSLASTLQLYASVHGARRRIFGGLALSIGTLAVTMGAVADGPWDDQYGVYLWSVGAGAVVVGAIAILVRTPMEWVQRRYLAMSDMDTRQRVTATERLWAAQAGRARRRHLAAFGTELALGTATTATAFVVGFGSAFDVPMRNRRATALALGLGGTALMARGVTHWFEMSNLELGYQAYERTLEDRAVQYTVGAAPVRRGAVVAISATF